MNKFIPVLLLLCVILYSHTIFAQKRVEVQLKGQVNYFSMDDLKSVQQDVLNNYLSNDIPASIVESFPPYYGMQMRITISSLFPNLQDVNLGVLVDYCSTGGRVHYQDFSGEVRFDQVLRLYSLGAFWENKSPINELISFNYGASLQYILGDLNFYNLTRIYDYNFQQIIDLSCKSLGLEPNVGITLSKYRFSLGANLGYMIAKQSEFRIDSYKYRNDQGLILKLGMTGFRMGLTFGYEL